MEVKSKIKNIQEKLEEIFSRWDLTQALPARASLAHEMNKLIREKKYLDTALKTIEEAHR